MVEVAAIGDNITDCFVDFGLMFPGGNAVNVSVQAARAGCQSAYVGVVGDDPRGGLLRDALLIEAVNVDKLHVRSGETAFVDVRHVEGERVFERMDRGVSLLEPSREDLQFASSAQIVHTTYCSGMEDSLAMLASSTHVSFDFDTHLADDYAQDVIQNVWAAEFSASGLDNLECESLLRWAISSGATHAFATRASLGAVYFDGHQFFAVAAEQIEPVDTLGAGDAFIGRTLCGLLRNESPLSFLTAGVSAASRACQHQGGFGHGVPVPTSHRTSAEPSDTVGVRDNALLNTGPGPTSLGAHGAAGPA